MGFIATTTGLVINPIFDVSVNSAPSGGTTLRAAFQTAANMIMAVGSTTPVTICFGVGYGFQGTNGIPISNQSSSTSVTTAFSTNYTTVLGALKANNRSAAMTSVIKQITAQGPTGPSGNPFGSTYFTSFDGAKLLGIIPSDNLVYAQIGIGTSYPSASWVTGFLHEIAECLGRVATYAPDNFSRFLSTGSWDLAGTTASAYFSLDNGVTALAQYDGPSGDFGDFSGAGPEGTNDVFCASLGASPSNTLSTIDKQLLNALGVQ
jgi:hypothetical protein